MPPSEDGRRGDALQPQNKSGFFEIRGSRGAVLWPLRLDAAHAGFDDRAKMDSLPDSSAVTPVDWLLRVGRLADTAEDLLGGLCDMLVARGMALRFNEGRPMAIPDTQATFLALGNGWVFGVPIPVGPSQPGSAWHRTLPQLPLLLVVTSNKLADLVGS